MFRQKLSAFCVHGLSALSQQESFLIDAIHDPLPPSFVVPYPLCVVQDQGNNGIDTLGYSVIDPFPFIQKKGIEDLLSPSLYR